MTGLLKHPLRVGIRMVWLASELVWLAINFVIHVLLTRGSCPLAARASWLQAGCRRLLRIFNAQVRASGPIPKSGLLVSNHLSYLDVLVLSSLTPSLFVAKRDVKNWPVFGWFAQMGGTLFADRERRTQVVPLTKALRTVLDQGALVTLFPEGTSSNGQTVLPFKSALLGPVTNCGYPLSASSIEYSLEDGEVRDEVCYCNDMSFVPHLFNLLSKRRIEASVRCSSVHQGSRTRKELAHHLRSEVLKLRERVAVPRPFGVIFNRDGSTTPRIT
jgi:1-acyl-sn-glycerol-3-phosphate acyltransferase